MLKLQVSLLCKLQTFAAAHHTTLELVLEEETKCVQVQQWLLPW